MTSSNDLARMSKLTHIAAIPGEALPFLKFHSTITAGARGFCEA